MPSLAALPTFDAERELFANGYRRVAGVDEVGRGSWAGPIVAAAVVLPDDATVIDELLEVRDSKQLSAAERVRLSRVVLRVAEVGFGWASHHIIDRQGIAAANRRAMIRAVQSIKPAPDALLIDYFRLPELDVHQIAGPRGDANSLSIAAASIVAKVMRDRWMERCDARFPGYGFAGHKGYGTRNHRDRLAALGPCALHRLSFSPIAALQT